jgi:hypothetical protein
MANALYPLWKQALMQELPTNKSLDQGDLNAANGCYLSLVNTDVYTYSDAHQFYTSIAGVIGTPQLITGGTVTGRIFAGNAASYTNVTGAKVGALVMARQNSGASGTWRLVLYEDTGIVGLPMIPSGGNILVTWNTQGIFGL